MLKVGRQEMKFNEAANLLGERTCCSRVERSSRSGTGTVRRRTEHRLRSDTTCGIRTRSPVLHTNVALCLTFYNAFVL